MTDTTTRLKKIIVDHLEVAPEKVVDTANFVDDLSADSLDTIELLMAAEEEFDIELPDAEVEECKTFGDAVALIDKKLEA